MAKAKRLRGDPAHAPGKHHLAPLPGTGRAAPRTGAVPPHDQPWVPTSGLVGRTRRSARRG